MTQLEDIRFYCGIGEKDFNHHEIVAGEYACISPVVGRGGIDKNGKVKKQSVNGVYVPSSVKQVLLDSGAYSDTTFHRLSFDEALERQLAHAERFNYLSRVFRIVSYDVLVDEQTGITGERVKDRMTPDIARFAVDQTIKASYYLSSQREYITQRIGHNVSLVFSLQGSNPQQYLECAKAILPLVQRGDVIGLGGWCILGLHRKLIPMFHETMGELIPLLKQHHVQDIHIFGVCTHQVLGPLLYQCDHNQLGERWVSDNENRIHVSTDSVGPTTRMVKEYPNKPGYCSWGYGSWSNSMYPLAKVHDTCKVKDTSGNKTPTCSADNKCRGLERQRHVLATIDWLADFKQKEPASYHPVPSGDSSIIHIKAS